MVDIPLPARKKCSLAKCCTFKNQIQRAMFLLCVLGWWWWQCPERREPQGFKEAGCTGLHPCTHSAAAKRELQGEVTWRLWRLRHSRCWKTRTRCRCRTRWRRRRGSSPTRTPWPPPQRAQAGRHRHRRRHRCRRRQRHSSGRHVHRSVSHVNEGGG